MAILEAGFDDAAVLALSEPCRRRLRTSNGMEQLNEEAPPQARHPHIPQSGIGHPPAGRGAKPPSVAEGGASQTV
jgi:hypothetical protein